MDTDTLVFLTAVIGVLVGFGIGAWWYRRTLKRDPGKLDRLADRLKI